MTCIVGIAENGKVYIGGDSAGVAGLSLSVRSDEKVFKNGEFLFGFTTSFRMGQLLRYSFSPPERGEKVEDDKYLVKAFIDSVRSCLKDGGFAATKNSVEEGGTFLLGYRGKLYTVESDYQVAKAADSFAAVGCGDQIAHGSLFATSPENLAALQGVPLETFRMAFAGSVLDPNRRIEMALKAAERFSAGVRGPFTILEI